MSDTRHEKWLEPRHHRRNVVRAIVAGAIVLVLVAGGLVWWFASRPAPTEEAGRPDATSTTESCVAGDASGAVATLAEYATFVDGAAAGSGCAFSAAVSAPNNDGWWFGATPETDLVQAERPELVAPLAQTSLVVVGPADATAPTSWGETIAAGTVGVDMRRGTGVHPALRDAVLAELLATGVEPTAALTQVAGLAQRLGPANAELLSTDELFAAVESGTMRGAITTEAAWLAHQAANPDTALAAQVPQSGSAPVELGLWRHGATTVGPTTEAFGPLELPAGVVSPGTATATPALTLTPELRLAADAMWTSAMRPMNTLIAMDVSGSMTLPTTAGVSRLELMIQAGKTAAGMFPYHSSSLALWAFSTDRGGPGVDYTPIAASGPADPDPTAVATTQGSLVAALDTLPSLVGGDTGLYDTVLAAVREVRANYVEGAVNSVVVLTDGYNDDAQTIELPELLETLEAESDPERPIRVVTIGISSDADAASLQQIAETTGGSSHVAADPADITDILINAMVDVERT